MNFELENGRILWFSCLGAALKYCHEHNTRLVRVHT